MRDHHLMRTPLNIDGDLLRVARGLAKAQGTSVGKVLSNLVRQSLRTRRPERLRNGAPLLSQRGKGSPRPTVRLVNQLKDQA